MSSVIKEPTFVLGYNINPNEYGLYEFKRSVHKTKIEKEIENLKKMTPDERAKVFGCTEIQAKHMTIRMISMYPIKKKKMEEGKKPITKTSEIAKKKR